MSRPHCPCVGRNDIRCDESHCDLAGLGRGQCGVCYRYHTDPRYRELWGAVRATRCPHAGEVIEGKFRECPGCNGKTRFKVFPCRHPAREPEEVTTQDCNVCPYRPQDRTGAEPLLLHNHLCPGDVLVMTAAVRSLHAAHPGKYLTQVDTLSPGLWEHNPDVASVEGMTASGEPARTIDMHYNLIQRCNQEAVHMMDGYCRHLEKELGVRVPLSVNRPLVYVSNREKTWLNQVHEATGRDAPFWVVNAGRKSEYTAKFWGTRNFQRVVDLLRGRVLFAQVGNTSDHHPPLEGVIDLRGKTDIRQLVRLVWHCRGVLTPVSFTMHLAAALEKPAAVVAGGREPVQWNAYPKQHYLHTVGMLPCCRNASCWKSRTVKVGDGNEADASLCEHPVPGIDPVPRCLGLITPEEVAMKIDLTDRLLSV